MARTPSGISPHDMLPRHIDVLRLLQEAQNRLGYLPETLLTEISDSIQISSSEVYGIATFYSFLSIKPQGRHIIRICKSLPCFLKKSHQIVEAVEDVTGVKSGIYMPNTKFSVQLTNCIGECDKAPVMMVDGRVYSDLTPLKIALILKDYE